MVVGYDHFRKPPYIIKQPSSQKCFLLPILVIFRFQWWIFRFQGRLQGLVLTVFFLKLSETSYSECPICYYIRSLVLLFFPVQLLTTTRFPPMRNWLLGTWQFQRVAMSPQSYMWFPTFPHSIRLNEFLAENFLARLDVFFVFEGNTHTIHVGYIHHYSPTFGWFLW